MPRSFCSLLLRACYAEVRRSASPLHPGLADDCVREMLTVCAFVPTAASEAHFSGMAPAAVAARRWRWGTIPALCPERCALARDLPLPRTGHRVRK
jgi:hypothetical protein